MFSVKRSPVWLLVEPQVCLYCYFSLNCDKAPDTGSLGREAILPCSQGMQFVVVVAGAGAAGHTVLAVRKQRGGGWCQPPPPFEFSPGSKETGANHILPLQLNLSKNTRWTHPKVHFRGIPNPLKLAMKINYHTLKTHVLVPQWHTWEVMEPLWDQDQTRPWDLRDKPWKRVV